MEHRYSEMVEKLIGHGGEFLKKLHPTEPLLGYAVELSGIRQATDADLSGGESTGELFPVVRGGLFYYYDAIEEAHRLVQGSSGDLAAYWHGMMHRREGDFENARYWFSRAGVQPFFGKLHREASRFSPDMARQENWGPYLFTGLCEQFKFGDDSQREELIRLQRAEFDFAFDYTWRQSVGSSAQALHLHGE